ncbi:MAG: 4-hydroxy-tetrahydrodipicolinate synthase [Streptosporangiaceae bacterium]
MRSLGADVLVGSFTPLVTPFSGGNVDYSCYEMLVDRQAAAGSPGIVVAGTSGEPSMLSSTERVELVRRACGAAAGRIQVVAGTGTDSLEQTLELSIAAERAGADALLVVTPYYSRPPQRGLAEYFARVAGHVSVPLLIYHIPGRAAVTLDPATVETIAAQAENLVGMKHASTDLDLVTDLLERLGPEFRIFAGLEALSLPMLAVGARGLMNAVGNLVPSRVAALWRAVDSGNLAEARTINSELWELNKAVFFDTNPIAIKYMLRRIGVLPANEHRLPMAPATPELEERLDEVLLRAGLLT